MNDHDQDKQQTMIYFFTLIKENISKPFKTFG